MSTTKGIFTLFSIAEFADYLDRSSFARPVKLIQNHHTFSPSYASFDGNNHFHLLDGMRNYHIQHNKWKEIGQNLSTFPDGTVAICRPMDTTPACIFGANTGAIGIEHVGNFDIGKDVMTQAHKDCILDLNALLCNRYKIQPNTQTIVYHHWYDLQTGKRTNGSGITKSCPGTNFFGGNKVQDADANFIPLVLQHLQAASWANGIAAIAVTKTVNAPSLNVRSAPGVNGNVIQQLAKGTRVTEFYTLNGWSKISANSDEWVKSSFLVLSNLFLTLIDYVQYF